MAKKKIPSDANERTTAVGLFNYAVSYWKSASALRSKSVKGITHPEAPIEFLYVHAIELILKSKIRLHNDVSYLLGLGHSFRKISEECQDIIGGGGDLIQQTIFLIAKHDVNIKSRYISNGYYESYPTLDALEETCSYLSSVIRPIIFDGLQG